MEEVVQALLFLSGAFVGFGIRCFIQAIRQPKKVGTLRIDNSEPGEQPYMFLELSKGVGDISKEKQVTLEVSTKNYISQK